MPECQGRLTNNMAESDHSDFFHLVEIKNGPSVLCRKLVEVVGEFISELIDSATEDNEATLRLDGIEGATREWAELMTLSPSIPNTGLIRDPLHSGQAISI